MKLSVFGMSSSLPNMLIIDFPYDIIIQRHSETKNKTCSCQYSQLSNPHFYCAVTALFSMRNCGVYRRLWEYVSADNYTFANVC